MFDFIKSKYYRCLYSLKSYYYTAIDYKRQFLGFITFYLPHGKALIHYAVGCGNTKWLEESPVYCYGRTHTSHPTYIESRINIFGKVVITINNKIAYKGYVFSLKKAVRAYIKLREENPSIEYSKFNPFFKDYSFDLETIVYHYRECVIAKLKIYENDTYEDLRNRMMDVVIEHEDLIDLYKTYNEMFEDKMQHNF